MIDDINDMLFTTLLSSWMTRPERTTEQRPNLVSSAALPHGPSDRTNTMEKPIPAKIRYEDPGGGLTCGTISGYARKLKLILEL